MFLFVIFSFKGINDIVASIVDYAMNPSTKKVLVFFDLLVPVLDLFLVIVFFLFLVFVLVLVPLLLAYLEGSPPNCATFSTTHCRAAICGEEEAKKYFLIDYIGIPLKYLHTSWIVLVQMYKAKQLHMRHSNTHNNCTMHNP